MKRVLLIVVFLATTLPTGSAVPALRAQQRDGIPADVLLMRDGLQRMFESGSNVSSVVAEYKARRWIARVIQNSPRSARSWQLSPEVVPHLEDNEIVDLVLARAQHVVVCTSVLWSRVSLEEMERANEVSEAMRDFLRALRPSQINGRQLSYSVGPDCVELVDHEGNTAVIRSKSDLTEVLLYERLFAESEVMRSRSEELAELGENSLYLKNRSYFESHFAGPIVVDHGFTNTFRRVNSDWSTDGRVYRFTMNNLMLYVATEPRKGPQLVFLAPFSW